MNVTFSPKVLLYFEDLVLTLYEKEYFCFLETSKRYVDELVDVIMTSLPIKLHKPAPRYFDRYGKGMYYAAFKKSKNTMWYAFFNKYLDNGETIYLIRYISNNHLIAKHLTD